MKTQSTENNSGRKGFTLVELMLSTVLAAIVMMACGGLIAGYWRVNLNFIRQEQTMKEISFFSKLFLDNALAVPSMVDDISIDGSSTSIEFSLSNRVSSIYYDAGTKSIIYNPDINSGSGGNSLLTGCVVDNFFSVITTGNSVRLSVMLYEPEKKRTNTYLIVATPRNNL